MVESENDSGTAVLVMGMPSPLVVIEGLVKEACLDHFLRRVTAVDSIWSSSEAVKEVGAAEEARQMQHRGRRMKSNKNYIT